MLERTDLRPAREAPPAWTALRRAAGRIPREAWFALLAVIPALLPLCAPGYFSNAHDAPHSLFFLVEFDQAIRDGALWPVWAPDQALGFGYPLWLVYAPGAYYVAEALHLLGLGIAAAVKVTWALSFVVGAAGMYRLARRWWGPGAGLIASVIYTYAPYHLVQIYVRAALAEFAAVAIFPWVLLAFVNLWEAPRPRRAGIAALALAALLLTHTVSQLIFVPLLGAFLLVKALSGGRRTTDDGRWTTGDGGLAQYPWVRGRRGRTWETEGHKGLGYKRSLPRVSMGIVRPLWSGLALALGILIVSIFLLPGMLERESIVQSQLVRENYDYRRQFVYPAQFFSGEWGYGYAVAGPQDDMSLQLGLLPLLGAAVGIIAFLRRDIPRRPEIAFLLLASLAAVFAMLPIAQPLWDIIPLISLIQFPWRLLTLTTVTLALLAGAGAHWLETRAAAGGSSPPAGSPEAFPASAAGRGGSPAQRAPTPKGSPAGRPPAEPLVNSRGRGGSPYVYLAALVVVLASFAYVQPEIVPLQPGDESPLSVIRFELKYTDMRGVTRWSERMPREEDSPLIAQYQAGEPLQRASFSSGEGTILEQRATATSVTARVRAGENTRLRFYTYYFPGWRATLDGQPVEIEPEPPNGLIGLAVPPGEHVVELRFGATPVRRVGAAISLLALLGAVGLVGWKTTDERRRTKDG